MTTFNLRKYTLEDAKARHEAILESTEHLLPWIPYAKNCTYEDCYRFTQSAEEAWESGKDYCFVIEDQKHQFVGEAKLMDVSKDYYQNKAMIAGWVRKSRAHQGATTYAWQALAKFGFEELGLQRIELMIMPGNEKSIATVKKIGAIEEGYLRNQWIFNGVTQDVLLFSLTPELR